LALSLLRRHGNQPFAWTGVFKEQGTMAVRSRYSFAIAAFALLLAAPLAPAQLQFPHTTIDVGTVKSGQPLVRRFEFENVGQQPVGIIEAKATCACAKPKLSQWLLQPGEKAWVDLDVHTLGQPAGPSAWAVRLVCKCGEQLGEISLQINATLVTEVRVEPAALQLFVRDGLSTEMLVSYPASIFAVKSVQTTSPHLKAEIEAPFREDHGTIWARLRLEVTKDYPAGRREEFVSIYTDNAGYAELKVPVTIDKAGQERVTATPPEAVLGATAGQAPPARVILLRDFENQAVLVEKITADDPAIVCTWAAGPGNMATLKLRCDVDKLTQRPLRSAVHIQVNQPVAQTITIPVEVHGQK
jgi:hypothetical protein